MSLGLAIAKVAEYSAKHADAMENVAINQRKVEDTATTDGRDSAAFREAQKELDKWQTLAGLFKDFLSFWTEAIKSMMQMLKEAGQLAFNSR